MLDAGLLEQFALASDHAVLKAFEGLLVWAVHNTVSDIHIEPQAETVRIRLRLDGLLHEVITVPLRFSTLLNSKIKMLAHLDIAEKRQAQDGRFEIELNATKINGRVSTCPTFLGEKTVIRLLSLSTQCLQFSELGMTDVQVKAVEAILASPHGLIIVTGPTGSGKTMTLYALLSALNTECRNIISIEDPVEMMLPGVNQIQILEKAGVEFKSILRSLLRQDPDVLMIGEIRDNETAEIAMKAAQTGHLVLSTLHTESAAQAVSRLEQLGIPQYLILESTRLLIAQRLVRTICLFCKGAGCQQCFEGCRGRTGIFEMILPQEPRGLTAYVDDLDLKSAAQRKLDAGLIR